MGVLYLHSEPFDNAMCLGCIAAHPPTHKRAHIHGAISALRAIDVERFDMALAPNLLWAHPTLS